MTGGGGVVFQIWTWLVAWSHSYKGQISCWRRRCLSTLIGPVWWFYLFHLPLLSWAAQPLPPHFHSKLVYCTIKRQVPCTNKLTFYQARGRAYRTSLVPVLTHTGPSWWLEVCKGDLFLFSVECWDLVRRWLVPGRTTDTEWTENGVRWAI